MEGGSKKIEGTGHKAKKKDHIRQFSHEFIGSDAIPVEHL